MDDEVLRRRGRPSKLDAFRNEIGHRSDEEIAKEAGCSVANVYMYRRRHNIAAAEEAPPVAPAPTGGDRRRGSVLDRYKHLLGKLSDAEVARLAGCTAANVSIYRRKNNIGSRGAEEEAAPPAAPVVEAAPPAAPEKAKRGRKPKQVEAPAPAAPPAAVAPPAPVAEPVVARAVVLGVNNTKADPIAATIAPSERFAYVVRIDGPAGSDEKVVIGTSLPDALVKASSAEQGGARISAVRLVGQLL